MFGRMRYLLGRFIAKLHGIRISNKHKIAQLWYFLNIPSNKNSAFLENHPEIPGRTTAPRLERPIEIGQVVEPAGITDFGDARCRIHQQPRGVTEADVDDIVHQRPARMLSEKAAFFI